MLTKYKLSLQNIFSIILILVIVPSITILLIINYTKTQNKLHSHLEETSKITLTRLTNSLVPFLESYSLEEYNYLIQNEMGDPDILAIVIKDNQMGSILGQTNFYTGVIRDSKWKIIEYTETDKDILQTAFIS